MSRLRACRICGTRWNIHKTSVETKCRRCRYGKVASSALLTNMPPRKLRTPTLIEWRQLATDDEVRAGHADWVRGVRNPLTAAMDAEHGKRALT